MNVLDNLDQLLIILLTLLGQVPWLVLMRTSCATIAQKSRFYQRVYFMKLYMLQDYSMGGFVVTLEFLILHTQVDNEECSNALKLLFSLSFSLLRISFLTIAVKLKFWSRLYHKKIIVAIMNN